jgi:heptosyltransferase I
LKVANISAPPPPAHKNLMRLLLVKTSSMGDVLHALSPLTDAARAVPGLRCDWLVEEGYAEVPTWHPAVGRVIPCALRRWRRNLRQARASGEWARFRADLRRDEYDLVLDAQGLVKSAWLAAKARGPVAGRTFRCSREGLAALFYDYRIPVDLRRSEIEQLRELFALALGYERPTGPAEFGLDRARFTPPPGAPYAVFVHGAAWPTKLWPEERWIALGRTVRARGLRILLPWGTAEEGARAQRLAAAFDGEVLPKARIAELANVFAGARFVVGNDTGLTHLAVTLGVRAVTLYGPSAPLFDRIAPVEPIDLLSVESKVYDLKRPNTVAIERVEAAIAPWLQ